jgi:hypothetical protein
MRLLLQKSNEKGDLFARLVTDVFLTLGYESPELQIHKTGREIDLKARHRVESKIAIAECKAHGSPRGGADLNKFGGVLQSEQESAGEEVQGYFVSLSGFTSTAREQEASFAKPRFVLLDGPRIESQLIAGGVVASTEQACESAGRLVPDGALTLTEKPELLGHNFGWLWVCKFAQDHEVTHFALIHADGSPLSANLAEIVIEAEAAAGGELAGLSYLAPAGSVTEAEIRGAEEKYKAYLLTELGEITLEGLPADEEVGAKRIALEDLYVPLRLEGGSGSSHRISPIWRDWEFPSEGSSGDELEEHDGEEDDSISLGAALEHSTRMAVLASPGGGKSTLIKRLGVAYLEPQHRESVPDQLPDRDWLPLFVRCRSLAGETRLPLRQIIDGIPQRGEFGEAAAGFSEMVNAALGSGTALLLIDGLDEIAAEGDRLSFVRQLRTFLSTYPNISVVLTSREAGFRVVGGALSPICDWYEIAELSNDDIGALTRAWHETVIGSSQEVVQEAEELADTIISTNRVRRLARNPLLLTTLLLVKRWVGDLPRKRSVLYEKAIEVLLMTWNVEAHEPIDREEAIPQLAFVAHSLTCEGRQSLSATRLTELLHAAREQMPEILGFARTSVSEFVRRIESRSSLLIMTGHVEENGKLVPLYEFRHLTFQEYLTAVALIEGFYADRKEDDRIAALLAPHFDDPRWFEVISLTNVLAGRGARELAERMLLDAKGAWSLDPESSEEPLLLALLGRSLADEVQLPPELVFRIAGEVGRIRAGDHREPALIEEIVAGRYGDLFKEVLETGFFDSEAEGHLDFASSLSRVLQLGWSSFGFQNGELTAWITRVLAEDDEKEAARAALCVMRLTFLSSLGGQGVGPQKGPLVKATHDWSADLITWCEQGEIPVRHAATWALAWLGDRGWIRRQDRVRGLRVLLHLWRHETTLEGRRQAAWAFATMPLVEDRDPLGEVDLDLLEFIEEEFTSTSQGLAREDRQPAAVVLAFYTNAPWPADKLQAAAWQLKDWSNVLRLIAERS